MKADNFLKPFLFILLVGNLSVFAYLDIRMLTTPAPKVQLSETLSEKKKDPVQFEKQIEERIKKIQKKKIINILETETVTTKLVKEIFHEKTISVPLAVMIRRENILEENPSPMPGWVVKLPDEKNNLLYFIGTRTHSGKGTEETLEEAYQQALMEVYYFIGLKMDYEVDYQMIVENDEKREEMSKTIQKQILGNLPDIEKIIERKGTYARKVKEPAGSFMEAHVLVSCRLDRLKEEIEKSIQKTVNDLGLKEKSLEVEKQKELLDNILNQYNETLVLTEQEKEAYNLKRSRFEVIEQSSKMGEISYPVFLWEKNLLFDRKEEKDRYYQEAYDKLKIKLSVLQKMTDMEEHAWDSKEAMIEKRLGKADFYFSGGYFVSGYETTISALEALLSDYDTMKKAGLFKSYLQKIESRLFPNLDKIAYERYSGFQIVNHKIVFTGKGQGNIYAYFNRAGQLLYSISKESEGQAYAFYSGERIIYKLLEEKNGAKDKTFAVYNHRNQLEKVVK